ncbi:hypothetical protein G9C85_06945 [Halorubellus sp. JP-L1]|uniref:hypothetical protein n=1 Tax=Halorubellus sp. JP-L1 TaxID=2715753 RepID=UPI00140BD82E|nr:hypothetical protein [Halorubellus sp. JP-L1]NHN41374.1 hypothetical protein [Halorubellus sp. JP-L1]
MGFEGFAYLAGVVGVAIGMAGLLAAEYFDGVDILLPVGGVVALGSVGAITYLVSRHDPPAHGEH